MPQVATVSVYALPDPVPTDSVIVDVRETVEWRAGHISGAIHIPMAELPNRLDELAAFGTLYVICRSGHRSEHATTWLRENGRDARNIAGGMFDWVAAGHPMVSDNGLPADVI